MTGLNENFEKAKHGGTFPRVPDAREKLEALNNSLPQVPSGKRPQIDAQIDVGAKATKPVIS